MENNKTMYSKTKKFILFFMAVIYLSAFPLLKVVENINNLSRLNQLALSYGKQGNFEKEEHLLKKAIDIGRTELKENSRSFGMLLNNLAVSYIDQGKYDQAEPLSKRALTIAEKVHGKYSKKVSSRLKNLARIYEEQGKYGDAEHLRKRIRILNKRAEDQTIIDHYSKLKG